MAREQEGGRKIEEEGSGRNTEAGATTKPATTFDVAEEAAIASAGDNRACSDGGSGKDKCSGHEGVGSRGSSKTGPLCYGHRSWEKLLCLQGIRAHGPQL